MVRLIAVAGMLALSLGCAGMPAVGEPAASPEGKNRADHLSVYRPEGAEKWPVAILLPGGRGAEGVGKAWPGYHHYAKRLASRGVVAVVVDYARIDRGLVDQRRLIELGSALDKVRQMPDVDLARVFVVGFSLGGSNALMLAASREGIAGVVTFFSPVEFTWGPPSHGTQPIAFVPRLHCPVLVLQGDADVITEPSQADRLLAALRLHHVESNLVIFPGQAHGFTFEGSPRGPCCNFDESATAKSVDLVVAFMARGR